MKFLRSLPASQHVREFRKKIKRDFGFRPGNPLLFKLAFQHRSLFPQANTNNERLEFLGDAVLSLIVSDYFYSRYPLNEEGHLSRMRSKLIKRSQLNKIAYDFGISGYVEFDKSIILDNRPYNDLFGNALEAFIGAMYIDRGYNFTRKYVVTRIVDRILDINELVEREDNFKGKLYEYIQKENLKIRFVTEESEQNNQKVYHSYVYIEGNELGSGMGHKKKSAEQHAAEVAFRKLTEGT